MYHTHNNNEPRQKLTIHLLNIINPHIRCSPDDPNYSQDKALKALQLLIQELKTIPTKYLQEPLSDNSLPKYLLSLEPIFFALTKQDYCRACSETVKYIYHHDMRYLSNRNPLIILLEDHLGEKNL